MNKPQIYIDRQRQLAMCMISCVWLGSAVCVYMYVCVCLFVTYLDSRWSGLCAHTHTHTHTFARHRIAAVVGLICIISAHSC